MQAWLRIMRSAPDWTFYACTKSVPLFREHVEPDPPAKVPAARRVEPKARACGARLTRRSAHGRRGARDRAARA
ncbi:hypothetical protein [Streptomyces sp. NPDC056527]|uniref:GP88 family protein n=1 Tax=Streptomyces sp. NPDC056527 TaxID=3345853 RepID=UPI0036A744A7